MISTRGRQAEARRNDALVLAAALDVFSADPTAPMSAVARSAGVGQATLYRRYPAKEALLIAVARHSLQSITDQAESALGATKPWDGLAGFLSWYAGSGMLRTGRLLGTFTPPEELYELAGRGNLAMQELVDRAKAAEVIRTDVTGADLTLIASQLAALETADAARTATLRQRYLDLILQALALTDAPAITGPPPDGGELEAPWQEQR